MLAIPYLHHTGYPVGVRFRCFEQHEHEGHGKYMSVSGDPVRVYNVGAVHRATDTLEITEGEFDAQVLEQIGLYAVAIPGASSWQSHYYRLFMGFSKIRVWGDPDKAGAEFVTRVTRSLRQARGVDLRAGDVTETYLQGGRDALLDLIEREE